MAKCEWCGAIFDTTEAEYFFESEEPGLSYKRFRTCLCGKCAVEAIETSVDGVYFEICEKCGKTFDLIEDEGTFNSYQGYIGAELRDFWNGQNICADCAMEANENISVSEAAKIWDACGRDEDYMFGYTEEELEAEL